MDLALFDLDNTLLRGDSDYNWAKFLIKHHLLDPKLHQEKNEIFYQDYRKGTLDIYAFCEFQFRPLKENNRDKLDNLRHEYIETVIKPLVSKKSLELVRKHQKRGDLCIVITATNSYITQPIARLFDIDYLIGTDPEEVAGEFTGKVKGLPSFKEGKVTRLNQWLKENNYDFHQFEKSFFYSDSLNDLPLLKAVSDPVCVNPDKTLIKEAQANHWPVISLED